MADVRISELPAGAGLTGTEIVPLVQGGVTRRTTAQAIADLSPAGVTDHGALTGLADDDHTQYLNNARGDARYPPLARNIIAGNGLTGGGDLSADRTLNVGAGDGITVTADAVALNPANTKNTDHALINVNAGAGLTGGGNLTETVTLSIANNGVTLAMMADIATATFLGRTTAGAGDPEVLTAAAATALLNNFTTSLKGLVPPSGGGTANYLRADGTWAAPPGAGVSDHGALTGLADDDHTQYHTDARGDARYYTQGQLNAGQLDSRYFTESESDSRFAQLVHTHASTAITDSTAAGRAMLQAASAAAQTALLDTFTTSLKGLVPPSGGGTSNYLRADGTWATPPGSAGVTDHGALTGLGDDDHTQYHTDARGDARYFTQAQLNAGQLDGRYYTESEVNSLLGGYQPLDTTLGALAALNATAGLLEQTGADTFTKRAIGVGASTSIPTRQDADTRYAGISHGHTVSQISDITAAGASMVTAANAAAQTSLLDLFTTTTKGLVGPSSGGTSNFLRADGAWAPPPLAAFDGVKAQLGTSGAVTLTDTVTYNALFTAEEYDTSGWHSVVTNVGRFVVPANVAYVDIMFKVKVVGNAVPGAVIVSMARNGSLVPARILGSIAAALDGETYVYYGHFPTGAIPVAPGDYFEFYVTYYDGTGGNATMNQNETWVAIRKVA